MTTPTGTRQKRLSDISQNTKLLKLRSSSLNPSSSFLLDLGNDGYRRWGDVSEDSCVSFAPNFPGNQDHQGSLSNTEVIRGVHHKAPPKFHRITVAPFAQLEVSLGPSLYFCLDPLCNSAVCQEVDRWFVDYTTKRADLLILPTSFLESISYPDSILGDKPKKQNGSQDAEPGWLYLLMQRI